jgi:hypothetical protein
VKFYSLSLWLNGGNNILIATADIFNDINSDIFTENCKVSLKKSQIDMKNMSAIITLNVSFLKKDFSCLFDHFPGKARILNLVDNTDREREALQELIRYEHEKFETVKIKDFPINRQ